MRVDRTLLRYRHHSHYAMFCGNLRDHDDPVIYYVKVGEASVKATLIPGASQDSFVCPECKHSMFRSKKYERIGTEAEYLQKKIEVRKLHGFG